MSKENQLVDIDTFAPTGPYAVTPEGKIKFLYENNGSMRVTLQDTTAPLFQYYAMRELQADITLTSDVAIGDEVINVSAGHGFTAAPGEYITLFEDSKFTQAKVKSVATNAITVQAPMTAVFTQAGATMVRGNINMNVDGSGAGGIEFLVNMRDSTIPIDITKVVITMQHGVLVPDDAKFGGLGALDNGLFFKKEDGSTFPFGNYMKNKDFRDMGGSIDYTPNAPAGANSTSIVFDMKAIFGQVIRLKPTDADKIVGIVRDNINAAAGMDEMTVSFIGSYTEGEA